MAVYLYSRVSLEDQSVENQKLAAVRAVGHIDEVFADHGISGGKDAMSRPQFAALMAKLLEGDIVVCAAADRIGRKTADVILTVEKFVDMKVKLIILAYGNMDFTSPMGMAMLTVGAAFAALERSDIRRRTSQGMIRVKAEGVKLGQPLKISPNKMRAIMDARSNGISVSALAEEHGIERSTVSRNLKRWGSDFEGYRQEYVAREGQYVESKRETTQKIHSKIYETLKGSM